MWIVPTLEHDDPQRYHSYGTKVVERVRWGGPRRKPELAASARWFERAIDFEAALPSFFAITIAPFAAMLDRLLRLEELRPTSALQHAMERGRKKQELEAILGDAENTPDVGPIEDYLHAVATERKLPAFAVGTCTLRIEEAAPTLRGVLLRAAEGEELSDDESLLLFRGLHILGGTRDREACQPLLRLPRRPFDEVNALLGDIVIESLANIVTGGRSSMTTLPWPNMRPATSIDSRNTTSVTLRTCWYRWIGRAGTEDVFDEDGEEAPSTDFAYPGEPVRNPWRHVGRNDPCPCGSGKKFKKCCLAYGEPPV